MTDDSAAGAPIASRLHHSRRRRWVCPQALSCHDSRRSAPAVRRLYCASTHAWRALLDVQRMCGACALDVPVQVHQSGLAAGGLGGRLRRAEQIPGHALSIRRSVALAAAVCAMVPSYLPRLLAVVPAVVPASPLPAQPLSSTLSLNSPPPLRHSPPHARLPPLPYSHPASRPPSRRNASCAARLCPDSFFSSDPWRRCVTPTLAHAVTGSAAGCPVTGMLPPHASIPRPALDHRASQSPTPALQGPPPDWQASSWVTGLGGT